MFLQLTYDNCLLDSFAPVICVAYVWMACEKDDVQAVKNDDV